ncbi:protein shuttle craft isoform X2 [Anabrus simplex]|uniref:protein shuttle craft isoform X2 n=1 Tax=Anabrus simplex TaxID=316456 RepID=UPI0035A36EDF
MNVLEEILSIMANWNSYYGPGDSQNYGFIPPAFSSECGDLYQNGAGNWTYFPVSGNMASSNVSQQLGSVFPNTPASFYGSVISQQGNLPLSDIPVTFEDPPPYFMQSQEDNLALAAAAAAAASTSSLTATAGEFVPRSRVHCPAVNGVVHQEQNKGTSSDVRTNFYSRTRGGPNFRRSDDDVNQRERLAEQLTRATLECLVCCERVRQHDPIWSCTNCYHVLHLKCIKKWAKSSKAESGWRCPACQNVTSKIPQEYRCFCGKARDPEWNRQDTAHTCGEVCGKSRTDKRPDCVHRCTLLCHPGPCPPCVSQVTRSCGCGKTTRVVKCGSDQPLLCGATCDKLLNCNVHKCAKTCHVGECGDCQEKVQQVCFCGKVSQEVPCTAETSTITRFSCGGVCDQVLTCGHHKCTMLCHEGSCPECSLIPEKVTHCPCGKTEMTAEQRRESCLDPIPTCEKICDKKLNCGPPGNSHHCQATCHTGPCPPCPLTTFVKCRCGHIDREISCQELAVKGDDVRCERRCSKKRSCGKHKCNQMCCIDIEHICPLVCNHMLSCGQHRCEELCHRGHCQPCWRTSFEELYCECGASVMYPPIPCGTRPPACTKPCSRQHECDHPALHNCHSEPTCPPCTVLVQRYCYGKHELRKSVPCHQTEISCGMPCNAPLPCGRHRCILPCHKGPCVKDGRSCIQPCTTPRSLCGHACAAPCHDGPCPDTPCKEMVKVTCECGHRSLSKTCSDNAKEYQRIATALLASRMADMQMGHSVDISDLKGIQNARAMSLKTLDCNDECKLIERNRRVAIGLQIRNPDLSSKLTPRYSDFMRQWAKKDPHFCNMVHEKLTELVQLAKQSKQKSRSFSFDSMNRDKRHFIHEYCEHFGCESQAYDKEPKRNVVATASRDKAWLPSMSLLEVLQRESGQRKVPKPVINTARTPILRPAESVTMKPQPPVAKPIYASTPKEEPEEIDYFELTS